MYMYTCTGLSFFLDLINQHYSNPAASCYVKMYMKIMTKLGRCFCVLYVWICRTLSHTFDFMLYVWLYFMRNILLCSFYFSFRHVFVYIRALFIFLFVLCVLFRLFHALFVCWFCHVVSSSNNLFWPIKNWIMFLSVPFASEDCFLFPCNCFMLSWSFLAVLRSQFC